MAEKSPAPLMRWTIEMGTVPGLGDDCAFDVYVANMPNVDQMMRALLDRAGVGASGSVCRSIPTSTREV